jgi:CHRD domain
MSKRPLLLVLALAVALAALVATAPAGAQSAEATKCVAYAVLKPGNEVRTDATDPVESKAVGAALVLVNGTKLSFSVAILNPARETFVAGHIHAGAAGTNGPVVVTLFGGSASPRLFLQAGRVDIAEDLAAAICGDLAGHYVNYHTTQDPQGAVRGQLVAG